jgi:tetratricopeptide (TPR) repeat protein
MSQPSHAKARTVNIPTGGSIKMKTSSIYSAIRTLSIALSAALIAATFSHAQVAGGQQATPMSSGTDSLQTRLHMLTDVQTQGVDHKEVDAYKAFYRESEDINKKIQLGQAFLQKYPKSSLAEAVDAGLVTAYYATQDWKDFYASADSALALKPDDVDVLTNVGWVIPHVFHADDPDADSKLDKAETYEKHALQVLPTLPKPSGLTDAQFATLKTQKSSQAHSGLGLVYFRREDYDNSAKELQQVVQDNPNPDQTDLFVLGMDLENLKHYAEAADAFTRCSKLGGNLQDRCSQGADESKKLAQIK